MLPVDLDYLAVGFLYTEGIITSRQDIAEIRSMKPSRRSVSARTSPGSGAAHLPKADHYLRLWQGIMFRNIADDARPTSIPPSASASLRLPTLAALPAMTICIARPVASTARRCARTRRSSSSLPTSGVTTPSIGSSVDASWRCDARGQVAPVLGRFSSEMVFKLGAAGIPIALSRCMPTGLAVQLADEMGITLGKIDGAGSLIVFSHRNESSFSKRTLGGSPGR